MSLDPNKSTYDSKPRVLPKQGRKVARNYGVIDIGTQMESFKNNPPEPTAKVILMFELPKELHTYDEKEGPKPLTVFHEYTNKASDRGSLCKVLKSWGNLQDIPKKLNLKPYLGKYCELTIEHKPKKSDPSIIYANIADGGKAISPTTKSIEDPQNPGKQIMLVDPQTKIPYGCQAFNKDIWFDMDNFTWAQFKSLPKYIQEKIRKSVEWPAITQNNPEPVAQQGQQQHYNTDPEAVVDPTNPDF